MNENLNFPNKKESSKTTFTFRISPENKLQIAATAKGLGMSPSQYMEALALKRHTETINSLVDLKAGNRFNFNKLQLEKVNSLLTKLKEMHPTCSDEELMTACLDHVLSNKFAWWERSLNKYLSDNKDLNF